MDSLEAALERARTRYDWENGVAADRLDMAVSRNRLRKVSTRQMVSGKATEMLEELDWWGIPRPRDIAEAERAKAYVLREIEQRAGAPGDPALREAGFTLLSWWCEHGKRVTATKLDMSQGVGECGAGDVDGISFAPSAAVAFLAEQLAQIVPELGERDPARPGWTPALDAAYTIARKWLEQETPHWTALDPPSGPTAMNLSEIRAGFAK